ncbi:hypothetical protein Btru_067444 [Bulinus truncatus]|nr:hypothetical protein Btru_067444 [Bulinus truncatus]
MLMAVCTVYTVTCTTLCLPTFIPQYMHYSITNDAPSNMGRVLYQAINIVLCVNSSCNFVIYVVMNKNFRTTYWSLVTRRSGKVKRILKLNGPQADGRSMDAHTEASQCMPTAFKFKLPNQTETLVNEEHVLEDGQGDDRCPDPPGRDNLLTTSEKRNTWQINARPDKFIQHFGNLDKSLHDVNATDIVMAQQYLSEEQTVTVMRILMLGVTPAISTFGVIGNIFSVIVLVKRGLKRSSNILLVSLAIQDISFLVGFNSVPKLLYEIVGSTEGFAYDNDACYVLFGLYQLFTVMDYGCSCVSLTLPVLITAERLIAVFLPLRFQQIVTSRRTWTAIIVVSVFWYGFFIHMTFYMVLEFEFDRSLNLSVGVMKRSVYHNQNPEAVAILEEVLSYSVTKIPPIITFVGCVIIGVKIKMASSERMKLTSKGGKGELSTRTTKMLLAVCTVYTVTCSALALPTIIPQYMHYSITNDAPSNLGRVLYQAINIVLCINSSCNFVIYVVMNKNFRSTYWSLFTMRSGQHDQ